MHNQFPLWKNVLLVGLACLAILYAIPNLYSEDPALQITQDHAVELPALKETIIRALTQAKLPYKRIDIEGEQLTIRFFSTDAQLQARDRLMPLLTADDTIALNLMPSTPAWLSWLHAEPMKQGLDLRGGVHFLLEVDVKTVILRRYDSLMKQIGAKLHEKHRAYRRIEVMPEGAITLTFKDQRALEEAASDLSDADMPIVVEKKLDAKALVVTLTPEALHTLQQTTLEQTMDILRKRVNELGVGEAVVQQQGETRVGVDLPGIQDATRAKQILGGTATLEFHLVDEEGMHQAQEGVTPLGSQWYQIHGRPLLLKKTVVLNGDSIASAVSSFDTESASPAVSIQLSGGGESYFTTVTREHIGQRMAILYVASKTVESRDHQKPMIQREARVISAPVINSALGHQFQITGMRDIKEATNLAILLRTGALPTVIYPIEERTIGPSLGQENIQRGLISLAVGMGLIAFFMIAYYRLFGLIANIALLLNIVFLCALLSMIGATLTLPGIAGIVLTVGMAVDANVLINERIREELRHGMSCQTAIYAGYQRAFATILDANLTTLIVGIVLFSVGSGPVRGFAVTLTLGLLTSMITGVTYTRAIVNAWYGRRKQLQHLSIGL